MAGHMGLDIVRPFTAFPTMPRNVYSEINLHIIWHTKSNEPVLEGAIEEHLHRFIAGRILNTHGVRCHSLGGTSDHVHIAVSVPPTLEISRWIGEIKGASAHHINHRVVHRKLLEWQT